MAYVLTDNTPENGQYENVAQVINALRGAASDELSAQALYRKMRVYLTKCGGSKEILDRLAEIETDECNHLGSLLWCINRLDESIGKAMEKGAEGD